MTLEIEAVIGLFEIRAKERNLIESDRFRVKQS